MYVAQITISKYYHNKGFNTVHSLSDPAYSNCITANYYITTEYLYYLNKSGRPARATYIGVECSTMTLLLYIEGLKYVSATVASIIALLEPVSALALAVAILGEAYTGIQLAGIAAILAATSIAMLREVK